MSFTIKKRPAEWQAKGPARDNWNFENKVERNGLQTPEAQLTSKRFAIPVSNSHADEKI